jgi:hypothetical protein
VVEILSLKKFYNWKRGFTPLPVFKQRLGLSKILPGSTLQLGIVNLK